MPQPLDFDLLKLRFLKLLKVEGPLKSSDICQKLSISQPTLSRLKNKMTPELLEWGMARQRKYASARPLKHLSAPLKIFRADTAGHLHEEMLLSPLAPKGFLLEINPTHHNGKNLRPQVFSDIPYFIEEIRPSGFLGRTLSRQNRDLQLPENPDSWNENEIFLYLSTRAWNLPGHLIIGEAAAQKFLEQKRIKTFPTIDLIRAAEDTLTQSEPGSSAGGEQPKFLWTSQNRSRHCIVKFSSAEKSESAQRVRDLLRSENMAMKLLQRAKIASAKTEIVEKKGRVFLFVDRFDRVGPWGRKGILSLRSLDLEFVGEGRDWTPIASALAAQKRLSEKDLNKIRFLDFFGDLIANNDRHLGNLSMYYENFSILALAPAYDMLPMLYMPQAGQLVNRVFQPRTPEAVHLEIWNKACELAIEFWSDLSHTEDISTSFRKIAKTNKQILHDLRLET